MANEGNLIKATADNPMVVINQIQPIYVTFSVPEQYLSEIKKYMSGGKIKVQAFITKGEDNPEEGTLTFVDNTVDLATGTIKLKATFANKDKRLWPGQFVDAVMTFDHTAQCYSGAFVGYSDRAERSVCFRNKERSYR